MKGIVLAGGNGTRLAPLTLAANKHLLPVGMEPMIFHPIRKLARAGIEDVMVVLGGEHAAGIVRVLGSGKALGCELTYRFQDEAGGIAEALGLARRWAGVESITVILGDNVFEDELQEERGLDYPIRQVRTDPFVTKLRWGARVFLKAVSHEDAKRFGVPDFSESDGKRIVRIVEKPERPPSGFAVVGIYRYDMTVWDRIASCKRSARGELEITDVNNSYAAEGKLSWTKLSGWWSDAGTFRSLHEANRLAWREIEDAGRTYTTKEKCDRCQGSGIFSCENCGVCGGHLCAHAVRGGE